MKKNDPHELEPLVDWIEGAELDQAGVLVDARKKQADAICKTLLVFDFLANFMETLKAEGEAQKVQVEKLNAEIDVIRAKNEAMFQKLKIELVDNEQRAKQELEKLNRRYEQQKQYVEEIKKSADNHRQIAEQASRYSEQIGQEYLSLAGSYESLVQQNEQLRQENEKLQKDTPPEPYTTRLLEAQQAAIHQFWLNYDPNKTPKQADIISWLCDHFELTENEARSIDLIIRPDSFKIGGNKRKKD